MFRSRHHRNVGVWRTTERLDSPDLRAYSWAGTWKTRSPSLSARRTISSSIECLSSVRASRDNGVRAKRAEAVLRVGQGRAETGVDDLCENVVAPQAHEHRPRARELVAASAHAAPDDEVRIAGLDGRDEGPDVRRVVRAVGVHRHDDVAGGSREPAPDRVAFAQSAVFDDRHAERFQPPGRAVGAVAIDHDHFVTACPDGSRQLNHGVAFVSGGDDDCRTHQHKIPRTGPGTEAPVGARRAGPITN